MRKLFALLSFLGIFCGVALAQNPTPPSKSKWEKSYKPVARPASSAPTTKTDLKSELTGTFVSFRQTGYTTLCSPEEILVMNSSSTDKSYGWILTLGADGSASVWRPAAGKLPEERFSARWVLKKDVMELSYGHVKEKFQVSRSKPWCEGRSYLGLTRIKPVPPKSKIPVDDFWRDQTRWR